MTSECPVSHSGQCLVAQHSSKEGEEPQTGLSLGRPLLSGVCAIRCDESNPERSKRKA